MIYAIIRAIAEWLADPNTGPNHYLPDLEREDDDATLEVPLIQLVLNPYTDEKAFSYLEPGRYPALYVSPAGPVDVEGEVNQGEMNGSDFPVAIRIVVEDVKGPKALRTLDYLMTALNRSISAFFSDDAAGAAARQRRHVQMIVCAGRSYAMCYEEIGAAKVGAILMLTTTTRDIEAA